MLFKDIKIGDTLYFYDRTSIELSTKKVAKVSAPYLDNNVMVGMVVDVSVGEKRYKFRESAEVGFDGDIVISPNKDQILREADCRVANNEAVIASVPQLEAEMPRLRNVINILAPERKAQKMQEERMAKMEQSIDSLKEMFEEFINNNSTPKPNGSK